MASPQATYHGCPGCHLWGELHIHGSPAWLDLPQSDSECGGGSSSSSEDVERLGAGLDTLLMSEMARQPEDEEVSP
jgi:hypothetical protein